MQSGTGQAGDGVRYEKSTRTRCSDTRRTVVLLGVPGAVVVDTPDALLVTTPEQAQDVKGVVDALRAAGREDLL